MQNSITNEVLDSYYKDQSEYTAAQNRVEFNPDAPYEANQMPKEEQKHFSIIPFKKVDHCIDFFYLVFMNPLNYDLKYLSKYF